MTEIICTIITGLCAVGVAIIGRVTLKMEQINQKSANKVEARAKLRQKESALLLQMQDANTQLTVAIANAVLGGHNNGNVEQARKAVDDASAKYRTFANDVVAEQISK